MEEVKSFYLIKTSVMEYLSNKLDNIIKQELAQLDQEMIEIDDIKLKPSECYHFSTNPVHLLFNTNCPQSLKDKISGIVKKYHPGYKSPDLNKAKMETKEYQVLAEAWINGNLTLKNLDSISGTETFSESYLEDFAMECLKDEFPNAEIKIKSVNLRQVN